MRGLAILLGFHLMGMLLKMWLHVPLPPNVIGLILFTCCLFLGWVRLEWVEDAAQLLLRHMMLFFTPFIVGTIVFWPLIAQHGLSIIVSLALSSFAVLLVTGWVTRRFDGGKGEPS
jgi:holin-like protein